MWVAFANAKATHIFSAKNICLYAIFNDQSFNDTLTNGMVSFEQLGPIMAFSPYGPRDAETCLRAYMYADSLPVH